MDLTITGVSKTVLVIVSLFENFGTSKMRIGVAISALVLSTLDSRHAQFLEYEVFLDTASFPSIALVSVW